MGYSEVFNDTFDEDFGVSFGTDGLSDSENEGPGDNEVSSPPYAGGGSPIFNLSGSEKRRRKNGGGSSPSAIPSATAQAHPSKITAQKGLASKAHTMTSPEQPMKVFSRKPKTPTPSPLPVEKLPAVPEPVVAPAPAAQEVPKKTGKPGRKPAEKPAKKPAQKPAKTAHLKQVKSSVAAPPAVAAPAAVVGRKRTARSLEPAAPPPPIHNQEEPQEETDTGKRRRSRSRNNADPVVPVAPLVAPSTNLDQAGPSRIRRQSREGSDGAGQPTTTPAAAAAPLDVSAPPSEDAVKELEAIDGDNYLTELPAIHHRCLMDDNSPSAAARDWISAALKNPCGKEARCAALRPSLQAVVDFVASNIDSTIQTSQNNSVLLMGGRGSGKTLCMERAVSEVCQKYNTDPQDALVGVVRLTGWLHADERVAFREIARQLCGSFNLNFSRSASMGDNIEFLRSMLGALARAHKVAVFILEDLDAFARRPKQTLLYCLLDALQTSGMQAVVLGTTCRHDCMDLLEKRVKSRFSHRTAVVCPPRRAAARPAVEGGDEGADGAIDVLRDMLTLPEDFPDKKHALLHNTAVKAALTGPQVLSALEDYVSARPTLHDLANVALNALLHTLRSSDGLLPKNAILRACSTIADSCDQGIERTVAGLSVLELAVLIAAHRAAGRVDNGAINFEMAHHEFRSYSTSGDHVDNYTKSAAGKAFERLAAQGLVAGVNGRDGARAGPGRHYAPVYVQVASDELKKGIAAHATCPSRLRSWFSREGAAVTYAVGVGMV